MKNFILKISLNITKNYKERLNNSKLRVRSFLINQNYSLSYSHPSYGSS